MAKSSLDHSRLGRSRTSDFIPIESPFQPVFRVVARPCRFEIHEVPPPRHWSTA